MTGLQWLVLVVCPSGSEHLYGIVYTLQEPLHVGTWTVMDFVLCSRTAQVGRLAKVDQEMYMNIIASHRSGFKHPKPRLNPKSRASSAIQSTLNSVRLAHAKFTLARQAVECFFPASLAVVVIERLGNLCLKPFGLLTTFLGASS